MPCGELRIRPAVTNSSHTRNPNTKAAFAHVELRVMDPRPRCTGEITCSGGQLKRRLRVVLLPVLLGALHVGSVIQQQLWWIGRWREGVGGGEEGNK